MSDNPPPAFKVLYVARGGEHFPNLPARSLTADDLAGFNADQLADLEAGLRQGFYLRVEEVPFPTANAPLSPSAFVPGPTAASPSTGPTLTPKG